ncbi:hypothetical protein [Streptomyces sp. TR06-5]|uniref:hypothetical protein n=1 Tax=unclassified Streptomyces TaxID=2593676 RepID=UPI0039A1C1E1
MQHPAGQDVLPHTRTRLVHWAATGLALTAVVALAAVIQPSGASAEQAATAAGEAPEADRARYPLDCGPSGPAVDVIDAASADFDDDGRAETVALVRCASPTGTPPSGIFVLTRPVGSGGRPRIVETLLAPEEGMSTQDFTLRESGSRAIAVTLLGYSSDDVPRCCPDLERKVTWRWQDGRFVLVPEPVARSV